MRYLHLLVHCTISQTWESDWTLPVVHCFSCSTGFLSQQPQKTQPCKNGINERNVPQSNVETSNSLELVVHSMTDRCQISPFPFKIQAILEGSCWVYGSTLGYLSTQFRNLGRQISDDAQVVRETNRTGNENSSSRRKKAWVQWELGFTNAVAWRAQLDTC